MEYPLAIVIIFALSHIAEWVLNFSGIIECVVLLSSKSQADFGLVFLRIRNVLLSNFKISDCILTYVALEGSYTIQLVKISLW